MSVEDHLSWAKLRTIQALTSEEPVTPEDAMLGFISDVNKHPDLRVEHAERNEQGFALVMDGDIADRDGVLSYITQYA